MLQQFDVVVYNVEKYRYLDLKKMLTACTQLRLVLGAQQEETN